MWLDLAAVAVFGDLRAAHVGALPRLRKQVLDAGERLRAVLADRAWIPRPRERLKNALASALALREALDALEPATRELDGGDAAPLRAALAGLRAAALDEIAPRANEWATLLDRRARDGENPDSDRSRYPDARHRALPRPPRRPPRADGRGHRDRADRAGAHPQPRQRLPVPLRQPLLLPDRLPRARGGARDGCGRRAEVDPLLPREEPRSARSGTAFATARRRARERFGFDEAHPDRRARRTSCRSCSANQPALYYPLGAGPGVGRARPRLAERGARAGAHRRRRAGARSATCARCSTTCAWSRTRTSSAIMRRAARSRPARTGARCAPRGPACCEYEIEAELLYEFRRNGAQFPAYWPIVAGGANACVLHYREQRRAAARRRPAADRRRLRARRLRLRHHAHLPGRTAASAPRSASVYELVLAAQARRSREVRPGSGWNEPHDAAVRVLAQGLIDLELCTRHARRRAREGSLQALLHAPHRATGSASTCTTPATTSERGEWKPLVAGHDAHGRARLLHPPGRRRARALLEHRRPHRGRRAGHRDRLRGAHRRRAQARRRHRGADARCAPCQAAAK